MDGVDRAPELDADDPLPGVAGGVDAGVVDEDVDGAELVDRAVGEVLDGRRVGDVGGHAEDPAPLPLQLGDGGPIPQLLHRLLVVRSPVLR